MLLLEVVSVVMIFENSFLSWKDMKSNHIALE